MCIMYLCTVDIRGTCCSVAHYHLSHYMHDDGVLLYITHVYLAWKWADNITGAGIITRMLSSFDSSTFLLLLPFFKHVSTATVDV